MTAICDQWIRKVNLVLFSGTQGMDLSEFHFVFQIQAPDVSVPANCQIRIYNLSKDTVKKIKGEFDKVTLNAGYEAGAYGAIFEGTIKQFRTGKESNTDTFLDVLAADGDIEFNQTIISESLAKGSSPQDMIKSIGDKMGIGTDMNSLLTDLQHIPSIRGTVLFGMARARLRYLANSLNSSWSIQNGKLVIIDNQGYLESQMVILNSQTGLIGVPEQTDGGIKITCLLNPKLRIGGRVQLDNSSITELSQRSNQDAPIAFNQWTGIQNNTALSPDGVYRIFVVEHEGDTRGQPWYSKLICLAVNETAARDKAVGAN